MKRKAWRPCMLWPATPAGPVACWSNFPAPRAVENDLAALVTDDPGRREEALKRLDAILREAPHHPQALWNRGLILSGMGLPRAGARAFPSGGCPG